MGTTDPNNRNCRASWRRRHGKIVSAEGAVILFSIQGYVDRVLGRIKLYQQRVSFLLGVSQIGGKNPNGGDMPQTNGPLNQLFSTSFSNEFGWFRPVSDGKCLIRLDWNQTGWSDKEQSDNVSRETRTQLEAYFAGKLRNFDIPLAPIDKSPAGKYWLEIMKKFLCDRNDICGACPIAGRPRAARAAGSACANNPIPIIYPCHRVIKSDGTLGNYGGGSAEKPRSQATVTEKHA